ncbi:uncharacterized protein LOC115889796 [Sitophilus oryzae]|uniref:Uncharacterized protein LOC115889796 n=1 Tax=Sitophilus oryzae TaxID=7048 RepID=A0A6J2YSH3_SITOR|nr:uncharacterized protein LOC115889796 [Sitophilus oryzae]
MCEKYHQFFITYQDSTALLSLSEYDTLGDLKHEIQDKFNIPVKLQKISGQYIPENDKQILQSCDEFVSLLVEDDVLGAQTEAVKLLKYQLPSNILVILQETVLEHAVSLISLKPCCNGINGLLLYLHNATDEFSSNFIQLLTNNNDVADIINNNFHFIGWDISNISYNRGLLRALDNYESLSMIKNLISGRTAAAVCIFQQNNQLNVFTCLKGSQDILQSLKMIHRHIKQQRDTSEIEATKSLQRKLPQISHIFHHIELMEAINFICTAPLNERKVLLLYLHNSADDFSQLFFQNLMTSKKLIELLNRNFLILGWDVEEDAYHKALTDALSSNVNLSDITQYIAAKKAAAVAVLPLANNVSVFMVCRGKMKIEELISALEKAESAFVAEMENERELADLKDKTNQENDMSGDKLQALFADMLGDRDYDRFEHNQHQFLKSKIGFALDGPPKEEKGYPKTTEKLIDKIYNAIKETSEKIAEYKDVIEIAVIYNCTEPLPKEKLGLSKKYPDYNPETDIRPVPIFILRKCRGSENPCRIFIDDTGRVYQTWEQYLKKNKLPERKMTLPLNGRYELNLSMSFANSEARGAYLNILAGSLGFAGAGANLAVAQLATRGFNIGRGAIYACNTVGFLNITASGVSLVNSGYDVFDQWYNEQQTPSALTIIQLSSSVLFFGHAVYNFKPAGTIIEESQAKVLRDYQDSLRSNRHRKTFSKLMKETFRSQGEGVKGKAEVISAIRNIPNKDEVFAALTRNNKAMNKNGIRFSADQGEIKLNGLKVDINEFVGMNKEKVNVFLKSVSGQNPTPMPSANSTGASTSNTTLLNAVDSVMSTLNIDRSNVTPLKIVLFMTDLLKFCSEDTRGLFVEAVSQTIRDLLSRVSGPLLQELDNVLPSRESLFVELAQMLIGFFKDKADDLEKNYQEYKMTGNKQYFNSLFETINPSTVKRTVIFFEYAINFSFEGRLLKYTVLKNISDYIAAGLAKLIFDGTQKIEQEKERSRHSAGYRPKKEICSICNGYYFTNKV